METQATQTIQDQKQKTASFAEWCILELFGHQQIAGFVTEATIGGCAFIRVDVPQRPDQGDGTMYTRLFGNGAIYAINITTEAQARAAVEKLHPKPYVPRVVERPLIGTDEPASGYYGGDRDEDESF